MHDVERAHRWHRWLSILVACAAASALTALPAQAQHASSIDRSEDTAASCSNGVDDDGDGLVDCADPTCSVFVFCAQRGLPVATVVHQRSLVTLQVAGVVSWAAVYVTGIVVTAAVGGAGYEIGLNTIPLAGPWLCLGGLCRNPEPYAAGLITSGSIQALGLALLIIGSAVQVNEAVSVTVLPTLGPEHGGLTLLGAF